MKKISGRYITLKYLRELSGAKQEDFGKLLGVTASTYSQKESGKYRFVLEEAEILQKHINETLGKSYTIDDIFLKKLMPIGNE